MECSWGLPNAREKLRFSQENKHINSPFIFERRKLLAYTPDTASARATAQAAPAVPMPQSKCSEACPFASIRTEDDRTGGPHVNAGGDGPSPGKCSIAGIDELNAKVNSVPWLVFLKKKADCPDTSQNVSATIVVSMRNAGKAKLGGSCSKSFVPKTMTTDKTNDNAGFLAAAVTARQSPSLRAAAWGCGFVQLAGAAGRGRLMVLC